jgi:exosome complex component RRP4
MESPRFINKNNLQDFATIGDILHVKVNDIKKGGMDLTLKGRGLGRLDGGRIIKINPNKVPRVIGREGSMINLIKSATQTEITVGQNGYVWIKGGLDGENKAEEAINLVVKESISEGLTEKIEKFLNYKLENVIRTEENSEEVEE